VTDRQIDRLSTATRFRVRFYDSDRGGVWSRTFWDETAAKEFAASNRLYGKRSKVETITGADEGKVAP
jgi:hypothetical protein